MPVVHPRNQAEAESKRIDALRRKQDEIRRQLFNTESEVVEFLNWAELPMTQKIRQSFIDFGQNVQKVFEANKWTEAEGRGIAYLLPFTRIIEKMISNEKRKFNQIQERKQKVIAQGGQ